MHEEIAAIMGNRKGRGGKGIVRTPQFMGVMTDRGNVALDSPQEVATVMQAKWDMHIDGGMLIANPVPEKYALDSKEMDAVIEDAIGEMNRQGIVGKDTTPFLLSRIAERTGGRSLETNIQLVFSNAKLAAEIVTAYTRL